MLIIYVKHKVTLFSFSYADVKSIIFPMLMFFVFFECFITQFASSKREKNERCHIPKGM